MACGDYPNAPIEYFLNWRFVDGAVCYYGDQIGVLAFMFIFFGVTFASLYQASGSVMLPVAVIIALAPIVMFLIPAVGIKFVTIVFVLMSMIGGFWIYRYIGSQ